MSSKFGSNKLDNNELDNSELGNTLNSVSILLKNEGATVALGQFLSGKIKAGSIIYLHGDLGAGKTTLVRGFLQGLGHKGSTKSPTYTLVEPYELPNINCYHFDLYRLADPEELEFMGIREYQTDDAIAIFEWPEKGLGYIEPSDIDIYLSYQEINGETGRHCRIVSQRQGLLDEWNFEG